MGHDDSFQNEHAFVAIFTTKYERIVWDMRTFGANGNNDNIIFLE